jgi:hypothetical protein
MSRSTISTFELFELFPDEQTARKGVSSLQLAKEIGVTQKSAWFMLQRLREARGSGSDIDKLRGTVEIDECFVGGKEANKHESKKLHAGRGSVGKSTILGMRERFGHPRIRPPGCFREEEKYYGK